MPKERRNFGQSKLNHVIIRGINKQEIFLEEQDKRKFIKELKETKEKYKYELFAYVLMPNHVHMQIYNGESNLPKIMQALEVGYTRYFNKKYEKIGPLFGDRYKNFPVETDEYFIRLIRYIHRNPEKARIDFCERYKWSSYHEYLEKEERDSKGAKGRQRQKLVNTEKCFKLLDNDISSARIKFREIHQYDEIIDKYKEYTEYEMIRKLTDEKVIELLREEWNTDNVQSIQRYSSKIRDELLRKTVNWKCVTADQLSRITGISAKIIKKVKEDKIKEIEVG